jgi:RNA polymerase sigma-70 factor, ECF subfamily
MSTGLHGLEHGVNGSPTPLQAGPGNAGLIASASDLSLLHQLRVRDEGAYKLLLERYGPAMTRLAMQYVSGRAVAEEVVQDTWMGVLLGLDRFEGRSSFKTWLFRILLNKAKTRGRREGRCVELSSLAKEEAGAVESACDAAGPWVSAARRWDDDPEAWLLAQETRASLQAAIEALPPRQRVVIMLRAVEGWTSGAVAELLGISEVNQRVLLHRARAQVRQALKRYLDEGEQDKLNERSAHARAASAARA